MRKTLIVPALFFLAFPLFSQNVLPIYSGFWIDHDSVTVLDLIPYSIEELGFMRNEIYARYGRAFKTEKYRNYFLDKFWYKVKSDYQDSWLTEQDKENARLILSVDRPKFTEEETTDIILDNIQYHDKNREIILTFTGNETVMWTDIKVDEMYMNGRIGSWVLEEDSSYMSSHNAPEQYWVCFGDWIIIYDRESYEYAVAYKLDHKKRTITQRVRQFVDFSVLYKFLKDRGKT